MNYNRKPTDHRVELMSFGRRITYLKRCIQVIELLNEYETDTSIRCRVFNKHINPVMNCSYATFNNMLNEPNPQKQILEIEKKIMLLKNPPIQKNLSIQKPIVEKAVAHDGGW